MTSPNANALMILLNNAVRKPKPTVAGLNIFYVGKDKYHMSILEMASVGNDRSKVFESL